MWYISRRGQQLHYMPLNCMNLEGNHHGLPGRTTKENHDEYQHSGDPGRDSIREQFRL
jgi:hypothetical protein